MTQMRLDMARHRWPGRKRIALLPWAVLGGMALVLAPPGGALATLPTGELVVFQAASLKEAFARLVPLFEKKYPGAKVVINAAGSQELRTQIEHGAAADIFASADRQHMDALVTQSLVVSPSVFACNEPVLVIRKGLGAGTGTSGAIKTFADLPRAQRIVVGTPEVPIGRYTLAILGKAAAHCGADFPARVNARVVSRELNVRQVLAKVVLGEADAGVVYRSDAVAVQGKVEVLTIPAAVNVTAEYPIALLRAAPHPQLARRWIELVKSPEGSAVLRGAGFTSCPGP